MDAIAVTIATDGKAVGLAPLGTSLTDDQAAQLRALAHTPVIATDADPAGQAAAERDYWLLTPYGLHPLHTRLPDGSDPADLVAAGKPDHLALAIDGASPLADTLIDEVLDHGQASARALDALWIVTAQPSTEWAAGIEHIADKTGTPTAFLRSALVALARAWNTDPRRATQQIAQQVRTDNHSVPELVESHAEPRHNATPNLAPRHVGPRR